jgi:MFS family permease
LKGIPASYPILHTQNRFRILKMMKNRDGIVLNICAFLLMTGVGFVVPTLPQKVLMFSGSLKDVGYLASFFALTFILFQVPIGSLADRFGFKPFILLGYLLCGISGIMFYYAGDINSLYLARSIHGLGEVPVWSLAPVLLTRSSRNKGKIIGIYNASIHLGLTIGAFSGVFLNRYLTNEHYLYFSSVSIVCSFLILIFISGGKEKNVKREKSDISKLFNYITNPIILIVFVGIAFYGTCYGIYFTIIPSFLIKAGYSKEYVALFFALFYLVISISQRTAGPLSDYSNKYTVMISGLLVSVFLSSTDSAVMSFSLWSQWVALGLESFMYPRKHISMKA